MNAQARADGVADFFLLKGWISRDHHRKVADGVYLAINSAINSVIADDRRSRESDWGLLEREAADVVECFRSLRVQNDGVLRALIRDKLNYVLTCSRETAEPPIGANTTVAESEPDAANAKAGTADSAAVVEDSAE